MQYGFDMKKKYKDGFRRNVRFEDADHTFVIDMLIPGPDNPNNEWTTVGYDRVLADRRHRARAINRGQEAKLCSTSTELQDLPSTGGPAEKSARQANGGVGMGQEPNGSLPSTGVPPGAAGYAGSGAGMGRRSEKDRETWGTHRA